jgi:hypothetical protein
MRRALLVVALVTVSFGCGGGGGGGAAGAGGTAGSGGTGGGAGGSGGSTADGSLLAAMPPCLATMVKDCLPSGTCTTQVVDPNNPGILNSCYGNGVKTCVTMNATANSMVSTTTKADGKTVCYKIEATSAGTGSIMTMSFKDAAGSELGTATPGGSSTAPLTVTCKSDGKPYQWDWAAVNAALACTAGTCACP